VTSISVVVLPGGGYHGHAPHEDGPVVDWLRSLGLDAVSFLYPTESTHPTPLHPVPLRAVREEVARVRAAGADLVGVLGFSAGGHAAGFATLAPDAGPGETPDFAILGYPVVSMLMPTHSGSRINLIGADASEELRAATSLETLVTDAAPPFFVWHTAEDEGVPVEHSYRLGTALAAAGVPHALHVYPRGAHGIGLGAGSGLAEHWTRDCAEWLRENGWIG
jgi:acetyl esterase/lipase